MSTKAIVAIVVVVIVLGIGWYYFSMQSTTAPAIEEGTAMDSGAENVGGVANIEVSTDGEVDLGVESAN